MKTGFRRKMYHTKLPPLEKESREEKRMNDLRYPWDYTKPNLFRGPKKTKNSRKLKTRGEAEEGGSCTFPEWDPYGVYTPRPKREHVPLPEKGSALSKYKDMNTREILATMRAKVAALPHARETGRDVDVLMEDLFPPLHRSSGQEYNVVTVDGHYDIDAELQQSSGLDEHISNKFKQSRQELLDFEHELTCKFGSKRGLRVPSRAAREPTMSAPPDRNAAYILQQVATLGGVGSAPCTSGLRIHQECCLVRTPQCPCLTHPHKFSTAQVHLGRGSNPQIEIPMSCRMFLFCTISLFCHRCLFFVCVLFHTIDWSLSFYPLDVKSPPAVDLLRWLNHLFLSPPVVGK